MRVKSVVRYRTGAPIGRCSAYCALSYDVLHAIKTADHDSTNIDLKPTSDRTNARTTAGGGHTLLIGNGDCSAIAGQAAIDSETLERRPRRSAVLARFRPVLNTFFAVVGECNQARQKERLWLSH